MTSLGGIKLEEIERASKKIGVNIILILAILIILFIIVVWFFFGYHYSVMPISEGTIEKTISSFFIPTF